MVIKSFLTASFILFVHFCLIEVSSAPVSLSESEKGGSITTNILDVDKTLTLTSESTANVNAVFNVLGEWGLSYVLSYCISDPKYRAVNKTFKRIFDKECEFYLTDKDPRFRFLFLSSKTNKNKKKCMLKYLFSTYIPTLPLQVPLAYLFSNFLNSYLVLYSSDLKELFPLNPLSLDKTKQLQGSIDVFGILMQICNKFRFRSLTQISSNIVNVTDVGDTFNPIHLLFYYRTVQLILPALRLEHFPKNISFPFSLLLQLASSGYFPLEESKVIILEHFRSSGSISSNDQPIFLALRNNQIDLVHFILDKFSYTLDICDSERQQPIHYAAALGDLNLFNKLVGLGADVRAVSKTSSVVRIAAAEGHISIVERIIELKSAMCVSSAFDEAIINDHIDIAQLIMTHPDLNFFTWDALSIAAFHSNPQTLRFLLSTSARVDRSRNQINKAIKQARLRYPVDQEIISLLDNYLRNNHQ